MVVEHVVGFLDVERATGATWSAAEFAEQLALAGAAPDAALAARLTDDALNEVRERRLALFARWAATAPGEVLELPFDRAAPSR